jgi:hypothetical protein
MRDIKSRSQGLGCTASSGRTLNQPWIIAILARDQVAICLMARSATSAARVSS